MRKVQYDGYGPPDVLYESGGPVPVSGPSDVLVRVHGASVNGGDVLMRAGRLRLLTRGPFPRGIGLDFAGEVVGPAGSHRVGDRVWGVLPRRQYLGGRAGSAAEYVAVPAESVAPAPRGVDLVPAAALPAVGVTALLALREHARLRPRERLLVRGATGGVGSAAVQLGHALGAHVTALAGAAGHDLAVDLGADRVLDYRRVGPSDLGSFDVVLDTAGTDLAAYRRLLTRRGRMVAVALDPSRLVRAAALLLSSTVHGSRRVRFFSGAATPALLIDLARHVEDGELRPVVDTVHPLADTARAHRAVDRGGNRGKHVVTPL